ncbi:MAG: hypothetical protein AABX98_02300, partial [Nanoarchaeota archaeon]
TCMAIDKVIAESVAAGGSPTLRFYRWAGNGAVSYGASQNIADVAVDFCREQGVSHVRRFTEARTMYHGPTDLTYAMAVPVSLYGNRARIGAVISLNIIYFLRQLELHEITHSGFTSILIHGRKISGSVPYFEQRKALFQHGSIFCDLDYNFVAQMYGLSKENLRETTTSIREESREIEGIDALFQHSFLRGIDFKLDALTEQEQERISTLKEAFATEAWLSGGEISRGACSTHAGLPIPGFVTRILANK